jgi:hypothetical protein
VKAAKVPEVHATEGVATVATVGVYPAAQAAVQVPPDGIEVTPGPHFPVVAPLVTVVTEHAPVVVWQVGVSLKAPKLHVRAPLSGKNPVAHWTVQAESCATKAPWVQRFVAALVTVFSVGVAVDATLHELGSQVQGVPCKSPAVHVALRSPFTSAVMLDV